MEKSNCEDVKPIKERKIVRVTYNDFKHRPVLKSVSPKGNYIQQYRKEWEEMSEFRGWLNSVPGAPTKAYCKVCQKSLRAHRRDLLSHSCSIKHTRIFQAWFNQIIGGSVENFNENECKESINRSPSIIISKRKCKPARLNNSNKNDINIKKEDSLDVERNCNTGQHHTKKKIRPRVLTVVKEIKKTSSKNGEAKKTRKSFKQHYKKEWENIPYFRNWLRGVCDDSTQAYCKVCQKTLSAHKRDLLHHSCSAKHTRNALSWFSDVKNLGTADESDDENNTYYKSECENELQMNSCSGNEYSIRFSDSDDTGEENIANSPDINYIDFEQDSRPIIEIREDKSTQTTYDGQNKSIDNVDKAIAEKLTCTTETSDNANESKSILTISLFETGKGCPVAGVLIILYKLVEGRWTSYDEGISDPLGVWTGHFERKNFIGGRYKIHIDIGHYYENRQVDTFFPFVELAFDVKPKTENIHISLLLNPFGFTTFRVAES